MKHLVSTRRMQLLAAVSLALVILPVIEAEPRCPGNVASVTPQFVQHALIVIPVRINQAGPFDFMVDTGARLRSSIHCWPRNSTSGLKARSALFPLPALRKRPQPFWIVWKRAPRWLRTHLP